MSESQASEKIMLEKRGELILYQIGEGSISLDPKQEEYKIGEEVELTADPAEEWIFEEWSGVLLLSGSEDSKIKAWRW